jgi:predicted nucleic acid-binding protein
MTKSALALDSNVLIRAVEGDSAIPDVAAARSLVFQRPDNLVFVGSELLLGEVLVLPLRDGNLELVRFYRRLLTDLRAFRLVPVSRTILIEAARLRSVSALKLPDAIHLATAARTGCKALVSMDQRIRAAGTIRVLRPDDPEIESLLQ